MLSRSLATALLAVSVLALAQPASTPPQPASTPAQPALPPVIVYAPSPCLSCIDWAAHLRQHGFTVTVEERPQAEMARLKRWLNVPSALESVPSARVGGYFVEGHVPAEDVIALLREQPKARGLAVPGLPRGAPGRESWNPSCDTACTILDSAGREPEVRREAFSTLLVGHDGKWKVFARH